MSLINDESNLIVMNVSFSGSFITERFNFPQFLIGIESTTCGQFVPVDPVVVLQNRSWTGFVFLGLEGFQG